MKLKKRLEFKPKKVRSDGNIRSAALIGSEKPKKYLMVDDLAIADFPYTINRF